MHKLRVALAQINVTVGDLDGSKRKILHYLDQARAAMAGGGVLGSLVPTTNQLVRLIGALEEHPAFAFVEAEELSLRPWKAVPGRVRPADRMVAHTGFLIFARAVLLPDEGPPLDGTPQAE